MTVHLLKLCVGAERVEDLAEGQDRRRRETGASHPVHVTRMWPKRDAEIAGGGSLYWVFKGLVLCRQRVLRLEAREGADGVRRCGLVLDPALVRVLPQPRRPFQGWRYLRPEDAPADLPADGGVAESLPPRLVAELAELGVF